MGGRLFYVLANCRNKWWPNNQMIFKMFVRFEEKLYFYSVK